MANTASSTSDFTKYFRSGVLSDVTLEFGDHSIKAHKVVLAQRSEYFRVCFEGNFTEAQAATIRLEGDDPAALEWLIGFLYGDNQFDVTDRTSTAYVRMTNSTPRERTADLIRCVEHHTIASKYLAEEACSAMISQFKLILNYTISTRQGGHLRPLLDHIYITRVDEAVDFRNFLADLFIKGINSVEDIEAVWDTMAKYPDLLLALMVRLVEQREAARRELGTATASRDSAWRVVAEGFLSLG